MEISFQDKHALVTGAGKGIGRGIAEALWSAGAETYAFSRTQADLDSLQEECPGIHVTCIDLAADWDKTAAAVAGVGQVDLLVNNAGVVHFARLSTVTKDEYDSTFNVNVKSVMNITKVVSKGMIERGQGGAIVNMSSIGSERGVPDLLLYNASKAALDQLTRCMAVELGPHKIRVNSLNPGFIPETDMAKRCMQYWPPAAIDEFVMGTPMKKLPTVKDVVNATLYLLSNKAEMITGTTLLLDGGFRCG